MQVVAITGSIGCGKTTIAGIIRKLGYVVYDADNWCRHMYYNASFMKKIAEAFPSAFENGRFNKRLLRQLVFSDQSQLRKLESLTHPYLKRRFLKSIRNSAYYDDLVFVDVAILYEMGWDKYCQYIIVAEAPYEVQKKRVMERDGVSEGEFEKIIKAQMDNSAKKLIADFVVDTNKSLGLLKVDLIALIDRIEKC